MSRPARWWARSPPETSRTGWRGCPSGLPAAHRARGDRGAVRAARRRGGGCRGRRLEPPRLLAYQPLARATSLSALALHEPRSERALGLVLIVCPTPEPDVRSPLRATSWT